MSGRPVAIVANTVKGKGVSFMENVPKWHSSGPDGRGIRDCHERFKRQEEEICNELGHNHPEGAGGRRSGGSRKSTRISTSLTVTWPSPPPPTSLREVFPERFVETGIAEQNAMSIAAGIATEGRIPFYVNFAIFVSGTCWTQLRQICYANLNVKLIATPPGNGRRLRRGHPSRQ